MRKQNFFNWLTMEISTSRMVLVRLYEQKDKLLFVEAPPLRKRYMEAIGVFEESVLEVELDVSLLRRKAEMIQIAVNRREPVDMQTIESALEAEKEQKVAELESGDRTLFELPQLSEQDKNTLQLYYRSITSSFHPAMNPDVTETQKELYEKAQEAYRMQNVEEMKLIYDMLFNTIESSGSSSVPEIYTQSAEELREGYREFATSLTTDYKLAKELYPFFMPLEEDAVVLDTLESYNAQRKSLEEEIETIKTGFPFNAESTLNDKNKTEEYLAELRVRAKQCETEKIELEQRIKKLMEGAIHG